VNPVIGSPHTFGSVTCEGHASTKKGEETLSKIREAGVVVHTYNPSTWEGEAGGSRVQGQPGQHSKFKASGATSGDLVLKKIFLNK
jgi:hypothetical protein